MDYFTKAEPIPRDFFVCFPDLRGASDLFEFHPTLKDKKAFKAQIQSAESSS
jgi:hypothetical protein